MKETVANKETGDDNTATSLSEIPGANTNNSGGGGRNGTRISSPLLAQTPSVVPGLVKAHMAGGIVDHYDHPSDEETIRSYHRNEEEVPQGDDDTSPNSSLQKFAQDLVPQVDTVPSPKERRVMASVKKGMEIGTAENVRSPTQDERLSIMEDIKRRDKEESIATKDVRTPTLKEQRSMEDVKSREKEAAYGKPTRMWTRFTSGFHQDKPKSGAPSQLPRKSTRLSTKERGQDNSPGAVQVASSARSKDPRPQAQSPGEVKNDSSARSAMDRIPQSRRSQNEVDEHQELKKSRNSPGAVKVASSARSATSKDGHPSAPNQNEASCQEKKPHIKQENEMSGAISLSELSDGTKRTRTDNSVDNVSVESPLQMQAPRPPDDSSHLLPGAHYVIGPSGRPVGASVSIGLTTANTFTSADTNLVAATLVDTEEEEQRIQDLEEQNRRLRAREQNIAVAQVVDRAEIVKSFFDLRHPEFRRQKVLGIGFILLVLVAIVLGIVLTRADDGENPRIEPTPAPTPEPTTAGQASLSEFLAVSASFDNGAALYNQQTPQYQASKWLANSNTNIDEYTDEQKIQRYVLATLYFSTNGDSWTENTTWLDDGAECEWQPKLSCTSQGDVSIIQLDNIGLNGMIPPELAFLSSSLEHISLRENTLTGTLPTVLWYLTLLKTLDVDDNVLSGTIMTELGLMTKLDFLGMVDNEFTGTIPTEVSRLTNLLTLRLGNALQGTIPGEISLLTSLTELSLWVNQLSGTIPSTLGLMSSMQLLYLYENEFVGTIPSEIYSMTNLVELDLAENMLSGAILSNIGLLMNLEYLYFNKNNLTGSIPSEIGTLSILDYLLLGDNALTSTIPSEISRLTSLTILFLNRNSLVGQIPDQIGALTNLVHLSLLENELTGTIPPSILNLTNLETLWLQNNSLTGPFTCPATISDCKLSCEFDAEACRVL